MPETEQQKPKRPRRPDGTIRRAAGRHEGLWSARNRNSKRRIVLITHAPHTNGMYPTRN